MQVSTYHSLLSCLISPVYCSVITVLQLVFHMTYCALQIVSSSSSRSSCDAFCVFFLPQFSGMFVTFEHMWYVLSSLSLADKMNEVSATVENWNTTCRAVKSDVTKTFLYITTSEVKAITDTLTWRYVVQWFTRRCCDEFIITILCKLFTYLCPLLLKLTSQCCLTLDLSPPVPSGTLGDELSPSGTVYWQHF